MRGLITGVFCPSSSYTCLLLSASAKELNWRQFFQLTRRPWKRFVRETIFSARALSSSRLRGVFFDSETSVTHLMKRRLGRRDADRKSSACRAFCSAMFFMNSSSNSSPLYIFQFSCPDRIEKDSSTMAQELRGYGRPCID